MPRILTALLCLLLPLIASATDPTGRSIPYQKLYEPLSAIHQSDPQGIVVSSLQAQPSQKGQALPPDLRMELRYGTTRQAIVLDRQGRFTLPLRADLAANNASLWVNQPKGVVGIALSLEPRLPPTTSTSYGRLMECLPVMERLVKEQAGMMRFMVPSLKGVDLIYAGDRLQTATVGTGTSAKTWRSDAQGRLRMPFDADLPAATPVLLSALPISIAPYTK